MLSSFKEITEFRLETWLYLVQPLGLYWLIAEVELQYKIQNEGMDFLEIDSTILPDFPGIPLRIQLTRLDSIYCMPFSWKRRIFESQTFPLILKEFQKGEKNICVTRWCWMKLWKKTHFIASNMREKKVCPNAKNGLKNNKMDGPFWKPL